MKKILLGLLIGVVMVTACTAVADTDFGVTLIINGKDITPALDVPPQIIGGRTMVPARFVAEELGASVEWDEISRTVTITGRKDWQPQLDHALYENEADIINSGWLYNMVVSMEEDDITYVDARVEKSLLDLLIKHFEAFYYADEEAFYATTGFELGMEFPNEISFSEREKYSEARVKAVLASDKILVINENGGRYARYMPVVVWAKKTPDSEFEKEMYYVGINKENGKWYITDWD